MEERAYFSFKKIQRGKGVILDEYGSLKKWVKNTLQQESDVFFIDGKEFKNTDINIVSNIAIDLLLYLLRGLPIGRGKKIRSIECFDLSSQAGRNLDLSQIVLERSLIFNRCIFSGGRLDISRCNVHQLDLRGSMFEHIDGRRMKTGGSALLTSSRGDSLTLKRGLTFEGANIGGLLDLDGAQINGWDVHNSPASNYGPLSVNLRQLRCGNSVHLGRGFQSGGQVNLNDCKILGNIDGRGGRFSVASDKDGHSPKTALSIKRANIQGSLLIGNKSNTEIATVKEGECPPIETPVSWVYGTTNLVNTVIGGVVDFRRCVFESVGATRPTPIIQGEDRQLVRRNDLGAALYCRGLEVAKAFVLEGSHLRGSLWLDGASFGGLLRISETRVLGPHFFIQGIKDSFKIHYCSESVIARGIRAKRSIEILSSNFRGSFQMDNLGLLGNLTLRDCGFSECIVDVNSQTRTTGTAVNLARSNIEGVLEVSGSIAVGSIELNSAQVAGNLRIESSPVNPLRIFTTADELQDDFGEMLETEGLGYGSVERSLLRFAQSWAPSRSVFAKRGIVGGSLYLHPNLQEVEIGDEKRFDGIHGAVVFDECSIAGSVRIGGQFSAISHGESDQAFNHGTISFRDTQVERTVYVADLSVSKTQKGEINSVPDETTPADRKYLSLDFSHCRIGGSLFEYEHGDTNNRKVTVIEGVSIRGAYVAAHCDFRGFKIKRKAADHVRVGIPDCGIDWLSEKKVSWCLDGSYSRISGRFIWRLGERPAGLVKLQDASAGTLDDSMRSWPTDNLCIDLRRFIYKRIHRRFHFFRSGGKGKDKYAREVFDGIDTSRNRSINTDDPTLRFRLWMIRRYLSHSQLQNFWPYKVRDGFEQYKCNILMAFHVYRIHYWITPGLTAFLMTLLLVSLGCSTPLCAVLGAFLFMFLNLGWAGPRDDRKDPEVQGLQVGFQRYADPAAFETLSMAFRESGYPDRAEEALVCREREKYLWGTLPAWRRYLEWGLMWFGFGFRPWMAVVYLIVGVAIGSLLFSATPMWISKASLFLKEGDERFVDPEIQTIYHDMESNMLWYPFTPRPIEKITPAGYPEFNPFVYSLDVFIPLVDFHQEDYWLPLRREGKTLMWILKAFGWVLSTFTVAALSRQIRNS